LVRAEGNIADGVKREPSADPARSENQGMHARSMRENREIPRTPSHPTRVRAAGGRPRPHAPDARSWEVRRLRSTNEADEQSRPGAVAELVEGRRPTEGNRA
jgi:hypothetical protein